MQTDIRDLLVEEDLFDPLADFEQEDADQEEQPLIGAPLEKNNEVEEALYALMSTEERLNDLMKRMPAHKRTILRLIDFCREEKTSEEMDQKFEELCRFNFCIYSPVIFRELLEKAGALCYVEQEAEEADQEDELGEPEETPNQELYFAGDEEIELEFLEAEERPAGSWIATEEGLAVVDSQDDQASSETLLGKEPQYLEIYTKILGYCNEPGGHSSKELDLLVNDDPILEDPRRYSGYFVSRLETAGAIEWLGGWCTTDIGKSFIDGAKEAPFEEMDEELDVAI